MEAELTIGAEIDLLLNMGTALSQQFAEKRLARQKRHDKEEKRRPKTGSVVVVDDGQEISEAEAKEIAAEESEFACGYQAWYSVSIELM